MRRSVASLTALAALIVASRAASQDNDAVPPAIDHCVLTANPAKYDHQLVNVRAAWWHSDGGEWVMTGHCFRDVLISLRQDAASPPAFDPSRTAALDEFTKLTRLGGHIEAHFIGRVEWSGITPQSDVEWLGKGPFGRSKAVMRLILRDVRNAERTRVPRR